MSDQFNDLAGKTLRVRPRKGSERAAGDKYTENEGRVDQAKSSLKDAGDKVKDAFKS